MGETGMAIPADIHERLGQECGHLGVSQLVCCLNMPVGSLEACHTVGSLEAKL